jgi:hypothetical protein
MLALPFSPRLTGGAGPASEAHGGTGKMPRLLLSRHRAE